MNEKEDNDINFEVHEEPDTNSEASSALQLNESENAFVVRSPRIVQQSPRVVVSPGSPIQYVQHRVLSPGFVSPVMSPRVVQPSPMFVSPSPAVVHYRFYTPQQIRTTILPVNYVWRYYAPNQYIMVEDSRTRTTLSTPQFVLHPKMGSYNPKHLSYYDASSYRNGSDRKVDLLDKNGIYTCKAEVTGVYTNGSYVDITFYNKNIGNGDFSVKCGSGEEGDGKNRKEIATVHVSWITKRGRAPRNRSSVSSPGKVSSSGGESSTRVSSGSGSSASLPRLSEGGSPRLNGSGGAGSPTRGRVSRTSSSSSIVSGSGAGSPRRSGEGSPSIKSFEGSDSPRGRRPEESNAPRLSDETPEIGTPSSKGGRGGGDSPFFPEGEPIEVFASSGPDGRPPMSTAKFGRDSE